MELVRVVEDWVLSLGSSPWILLAVVVLVVVDGVLPPVPSEAVVIAVAVAGVTGAGPSPWLLAAAAAVGAFCGDLLAFTLGSRVPLERLGIVTGHRGRRSVRWLRRTLGQRGAVLILSARFVPVGRVAVNMSAGAVGFPRRLFTTLAAVAAVVWAAYTVLLGIGAGHVLREHPLLAVVAGAAGGALVGVLVDRLLRSTLPDLAALGSITDPPEGAGRRN